METSKLYYIIIGCMYSSDDEEYVRREYIKKTTSVSNNVFERKLYEGFMGVAGKDNFVFVSAPSFGWFPFNCKKLTIKGFTARDNLKPVKYNSSYFFGNLSKTRALKKEIKSILKQLDLKKQKPCLVVNELHLPYMSCAKYIKKKCKESVVVQLVPDLPEFNNRSKRKFYSFFKKIDCKKIKKIREKNVDKYVLFSHQMAERLSLPIDKPYIVNYGISPDAFAGSENVFNDGKKHVTYLGKFDNRNGIKLIIDASTMFIGEDNVVFDLFGLGASDAFSNNSEQHKNVRYHGFVSPNEVGKILLSSDVLLSPRIPYDEYTKYSFPSKIFEYLAAHKPIVTFRLDCYPKEMDDILIYPKLVDTKSLFESIKIALNGDFPQNNDAIGAFISSHDKCAVVARIMNFAEGDK